MLKKLLTNRSTTLTAILFSIAFVVCGIAWMRFFAVTATNPTPVRYMNFVTEIGTQNPFRQECIGPAFVEADAVWRYCQYEDQSATMPALDSQHAEQWGLVRFDLDAGQAVMHWPLPEAPDAQILALAPSPDSGDLVVAWGSPDLSAIYRIKRDGGVESLGVPPNVDAITGLSWVDSDEGLTLELVARTEPDQFVIFAHDFTGEWHEARNFTLPSCAWPDRLCSFQLARYGERGWGFISATVSVGVGDIAEVRVDFNQHDEKMRGLSVGSINLDELDPRQYTINEDGELTRLGTLFDQSPANLINWSMATAPLVFTNDFARRLDAPHDDASFYFSNYAIEGDHLRWIPGLRYPEFGWYMGEWVTLQAGENGVVLAHYADSSAASSGGESGDPLTTDTTFIKQGSQTCVLPASDGGYWILGANGAYVKADESMGRADKLNVADRLQRSFENFGALESVQDDCV